MLDLAPNLPLQVQFVVSAMQARQILDALKQAQVSAFYVHSLVKLGLTGPSDAGPG